MSTGNPFRKVHTNFYRFRPLGLAWTLYQTFCWVSVIFLSPNSQKNAIFGRKKIEFSKFSKICLQEYPSGRCMPIFIVVGRWVWPGRCTKLFCLVAVIFLSPNSQKNAIFGRKKNRILKIFENMSIGIPFRKVPANFYRCRPLGLAWALKQTFCWVAVIQSWDDVSITACTGHFLGIGIGTSYKQPILGR